MTDGGPDILNPYDLLETDTVCDVYADGIAMVEPLSGDNCRVTYFTYRRMPGGGITRAVCCKIIRPRSTLVTGQITAMLEQWPRDHGIEQTEGATK